MSDDDHDSTHDSEGDDGHGHASRPEYDPENVDLPSEAPPLRSTAPQSEFTTDQIATGLAVVAVGLVVVLGLPLALA